MNSSHRSALPLRASLLTGIVGATLAAACLSDAPAGISDATEQASAGKASSGAQGGSTSTGGTQNGEGASDGTNEAGSGGSTTAGTAPAMAGSGGSAVGNEGGGPAETGEGGAGGSHEPGGVQIGHACTFHTDAPVPSDEGAGGAGPDPDVMAQLSPFVGSYLTDAAGRTLYTYGGDLPGDCEHAPQSTCVADCLVSWPVFDAGDRLLGAELNDGLFGEIVRSDGAKQTTYRGWPLYYYKSDLTLGQMTGQGKGKIWHIAEITLPSVTVMKSGTLKYLADIDGRTLYVSSADQAGTGDADPVSNCQGSCLQTFEAFHEKNFSAVTVLESSDFQVFVRHGAGGLQLSYKGMPLYRAATDVKSGDMTGTASEGFTAAVP